MTTSQMTLRSERSILPFSNTKLSKQSRIRNAGGEGDIYNEVNIQAMMSMYYTRTTRFDIENFATFLDIPGGKSCDQTFHHHSPCMTHNKRNRESTL